MGTTISNVGSSAKELSVAEAAYLAGFVDGEGCLTIGRTKVKESRTGLSFFAIFMVGNTDLDALTQIQRMCGNGRILMSDKRKALGHKPMYRLDFSANQIRHLLPQVRPYLRIKHRQADIVSAFLKTKSIGRKPSDAEWQQQENWRAEIRGLNRRGLIDTSAEVIAVRPRAAIASRECELDGCSRKHYGRGYCWIHYRKFIVRGGPKTYTKACVVCGGEFVTKRSSSLCCSKKCGDKRQYSLNSETVKAQVKAARERRKKATPS